MDSKPKPSDQELQSELQSAEKMLNIFSRVSSELVSTLDAQQSVDRLQRIIHSHLADHCDVWWHRPEGNVELSKTSPKLKYIFQDQFGPSAVLKSGRYEFFPELAADQVFAGNHPFTSYLCVPMRNQNQTVGSLSCFKTSGYFSAEDLMAVTEVAHRAALSLQNSFLFEELQKAKADLEKSRQTAESASQAKSLFLANMSHEIRTPLTAILGFSELMLSALDDKTLLTDWVQRVITNGNHLQVLIDEILDLSKVESGKMQVIVQKTPLSCLLSDVINSVTPQVLKKKNKLQFTISSPIPSEIMTDGVRLKQILINLINNSNKFTDSGKIDVDISYEASGKMIYFKVKDTGIGMNEAQSQKLFQLYTQTDASHKQKYGGTGLGLVISKKIAQYLDGDLEFLESAPGKGSTFHFYVHSGNIDGAKFVSSSEELFKPKDVSDSPQKDFRPPEINNLDGVKILFADDSLDNQWLFSLLLTRAGATVDLAIDGSEALLKAKAKDYDVILLDIQMPIMSGYEVCHQLRTLGHKGAIVALSGRSQPEDRHKSLDSGFNDHLIKPISKAHLLETLKSLTHPKKIEN